MRRLIETVNSNKDNVIQWHTQSGNITTNLKVKIYFSLPEITATKTVMWYFHMDDSAKGGHYKIFGKYLL